MLLQLVVVEVEKHNSQGLGSTSCPPFSPRLAILARPLHRIKPLHCQTEVAVELMFGAPQMYLD
jgi:hypothetical protein